MQTIKFESEVFFFSKLPCRCYCKMLNDMNVINVDRLNIQKWTLTGFFSYPNAWYCSLLDNFANDCNDTAYASMQQHSR